MIYSHRQNKLPSGKQQANELKLEIVLSVPTGSGAPVDRGFNANCAQASRRIAEQQTGRALTELVRRPH